MSVQKDIQDRILRELLPTNTPKVLEAGGGKRSYFSLPGALTTVIDVDAVGLGLNAAAHEKILGNLECYDYGERRFDLIVCWDVLEHLKQPTAALRRLIAALAPGGLIVIKGPVATSMKALATRLSPQSVHVAFYRYILGTKKAGQPGYAPFKTEFAGSSDETEIASLLTASGLRIVAWQRFQSDHVKALRIYQLSSLSRLCPRCAPHPRNYPRSFWRAQYRLLDVSPKRALATPTPASSARASPSGEPSGPAPQLLWPHPLPTAISPSLTAGA